MKRRDASLVYLLFSGLNALLRTIHFTTMPVYYIETVGMNPLQLVLVGTTVMTVVLLAEVPTGVVADLYSRRLSVIIGTALNGLGFMLEGALPLFASILVAQLIWGVGVTFTSGALQAWIADEHGEQGLEALFVRGSQVDALGTLLGIAASIALASFGLSVPLLVAGGGLLLLAALLVVLMPEHGFRPVPREARASWHAFGATLREGVGLVRAQQVLLTLLGITFFFGMASETFDRLWQLHVLRQLPFPGLEQAPVAWFGGMRAASLLLGIGVQALLARRAARGTAQRPLRTLALITAVVLLGMVAFGLASGIALGLLAFLTVAVARQVYEPLYMAWLNQQTTSGVRATVISLAMQVDAVGQIAGGPIFGLLALRASTSAAMVLAGLTLAPALLLYWHALRRSRPLLAEAPLPHQG